VSTYLYIIYVYFLAYGKCLTEFEPNKTDIQVESAVMCFIIQLPSCLVVWLQDAVSIIS